MYFGGGAVDSIVPSENFLVPRKGLSRLVSGTVHYRGISELKHGFGELNKIGGSDKVFFHTRCLASEMVNRLRLLRHVGGKGAIVIYGAWAEWKSEKAQGCDFDQMRMQIEHMPGPTIAFNILRSDGSFVGYSEVSNLAALASPRIHLRTGCFCNTGACQESLKLTNEDIRQNFAAGHVCGDKNDIINGQPTGAVRISFGKDSTWEDLDAAIEFITNYFVRHNELTDQVEKALDEYVKQNDALRHDGAKADAKLTDIFVFPIKSCAAMRVHRWKMHKRSGKLAFDREFALIDSTGRALRLSSYPKMALIKPVLDLASMKMIISAPACENLILDLKIIHSSDDTTDVSVCGKECNAKIYGDGNVSNWFSAVLGVRCWLAKYDDAKVHNQWANAHHSSGMKSSFQKFAFANDAPILLVSRNSVNLLNVILSCKGQGLVDARYFRPNLVVDVSLGHTATAVMTNPEDLWSNLSIGNITFNVTGKCARCTMVDYDPTSGMKGKTLNALADYRRTKGSIYFGIFLETAECNIMDGEYLYIDVGDSVKYNNG
uniref:MOSC domain-containing protein n=1 Tax=Leptocylindrus danicus TaxID=163516 RepID=A0A7S2LNY6_9STRA